MNFIKKNVGIIILAILIIILGILFSTKFKKNNNNIIREEKETSNTEKMDFIENANYIVEYRIPDEFELDNNISGFEWVKHYTNHKSMLVDVKMFQYTEDEYIKKEEESFNYYKNSGFYSDVKLSDVKKVKIENKEFKYQILICTSTMAKIQNMNIWYKIDEDTLFYVETQINNYNVELTDSTINEIKDFLNIVVKEK